MKTKLRFISELARKNKQQKFSNLIHLVNETNLEVLFEQLKTGKAAGVDRVTLEAYGENLKRNVESLVSRMKQMSYRPQPVRRVWIPKAKGKWRALGIPTVEDKLMQLAFARILEAIWEEDFLPVSFGFRPGRGCHSALSRLDHILMSQSQGYVVDADIEGFFDNVDHEKIVDCLRKRISDETFLRYIVRMLKSGVMEGRNYYCSEKGTPQGGVISPILANIYLHYLLDVWFVNEVMPHCVGRAQMVRYCDDFVIGVESLEDAQAIVTQLEERLARGKLKLSPEKTRIVRFNRPRPTDRDGDEPESFNFLGFTHYWNRGRNGRYKVERRTESKRMGRAIVRINTWLKIHRNQLKLKEIWNRISQMLHGHYGYYGVSDNYDALVRYGHRVERLVFKWLNRRSQKKSFNWMQFSIYKTRFPFPRPRIYHKMY